MLRPQGFKLSTWELKWSASFVALSSNQHRLVDRQFIVLANVRWKLCKLLAVCDGLNPLSVPALNAPLSLLSHDQVKRNFAILVVMRT
jgi:hypothetical protein